MKFSSFLKLIILHGQVSVICTGLFVSDLARNLKDILCHIMLMDAYFHDRMTNIRIVTDIKISMF